MSSHPDLHGNVPENSAAALLLIDVINDLEFEDGDKLLAAALTMGEKIAELKRRASASKIPTIYVNDNFGRWTSDFRRLVEHCQHDSVRGSPLARLLAPAKNDFFVLKPKHSGFFFTTLDLVLKHLGANNLILTVLPPIYAFYSPRTMLSCAVIDCGFLQLVWPRWRRSTTSRLCNICSGY